MTDLAVLTLMGRLTQGSAAGHRWRVPCSTCTSTSALTPCMPCSFGLLPRRRLGTGTLPNGLLEVTVSIRWTPLVTAAYGTWVARPARTTMLAPGGDDFRLGRRVRTALVTSTSWARARRARGSLEMRLKRRPVPLHPVA
jgi:hypothetical protein